MRPLESVQNTATSIRSAEVMERARDLFPGGVNSPVRAFRGVGGELAVGEFAVGSFVQHRAIFSDAFGSGNAPAIGRGLHPTHARRSAGRLQIWARRGDAASPDGVLVL